MNKLIEFEEVSEYLFKEIKTKVQNNKGLNVFAEERAKFEGWLKVEICNSLHDKVENLIPEKSFIDITFKDWAIELKTFSTNYKHPIVTPKSRPITDNVDGVIKDIKDLKDKHSEYKNKAILFVVFPIEQDNQSWKKHLSRITELVKLSHEDFKFNNGVPGIIYFGLI